MLVVIDHQESLWNLNVTHGRTTVYNAGCRCSQCREAAVQAQREYRRRNRDKINARRRERRIAFGRAMAAKLAQEAQDGRDAA